MSIISYLTSTVVMGVILLLILFAVGRANARGSSRSASADVAVAGRTRHRVRPSPSRRRWETVSDGALLFAVAAVAGGLFVAGAVSALQEDAWMVAGGTLGAGVVGYLAWGVHHAVRFRGRPNSVAVAVSAWALGLLFIAAVTVRLLLFG